MTTKPTGGFVFPNFAQYGITRRDWLAGLAMQALVSKPDLTGQWHQFSAWAYELADAMLTEGEK